MSAYLESIVGTREEEALGAASDAIRRYLAIRLGFGSPEFRFAVDQVIEEMIRLGTER